MMEIFDIILDQELNRTIDGFLFFRVGKCIDKTLRMLRKNKLSAFTYYSIQQLQFKETLSKALNE